MIKPNEVYQIESWQLDKLAKLALRLYTEDRMKGDEMRDNAQMLDAIVESVTAISALGRVLNES